MISVSVHAIEKNTCTVTGTIKRNLTDVSGIPNTDMVSATWSLKNRIDGAVINSRTSENLLPSINGTGNFTITLTPNDNVFMGPTKLDEEVHVITINVVANSGAGDGSTITILNEVWITVDNLKLTT